MDAFVDKNSIVRKIWGSAETVLFIFAGAAAEFALNKSVDWLYFTGQLPADPIGRLFSTVTYARKIIFSQADGAYHAIDTVRQIHTGVEKARGSRIPNESYRDVLNMLVHYSIASYELLERTLSDGEKDELTAVFFRVGQRMGIQGIAANYNDWVRDHESGLDNNLVRSEYTDSLYRQYRKHLGFLRYQLVLEVQRKLAPFQVRRLLGLGRPKCIGLLVRAFRMAKNLNMHRLIRVILVPPRFRKEVAALDIETGREEAGK